MIATSIMQLNVGTSDKKQYRLVTLDNGLECLLIHEPPAEEEDAVSYTHLTLPTKA